MVNDGTNDAPKITDPQGTKGTASSTLTLDEWQILVFRCGVRGYDDDTMNRRGYIVGWRNGAWEVHQQDLHLRQMGLSATHGDVTLGANDAATGDYVESEIAEYAVYSRALYWNEIARLARGLATKWGL